MLKEKKSHLEIENGLGYRLAFIPWEQAPFEPCLRSQGQEVLDTSIFWPAIHSCLFRKLLSVHTGHC